MNFLDLRDAEINSEFSADICIIGSGFAGLSIAAAFANSPTQVLILESGGLKKEPATEALNEVENVGAPRVVRQDLVRCRVFGGSSDHWTGRCRPFDHIDFQKRPWLAYSGWPVTRDELEAHFETAGRYLGAGPYCYDQRLWDVAHVQPPPPAPDPALLRQVFWQFSEEDQSRQPVRFGRHFHGADAPNIRTLLHANVTHINTNEAGTQVDALDVSTLERKTVRVKAKTVVLCCGGLENARLLLASNRQWSRGVGNANDVVGRFLMDHVVGPIGTFDPKRSRRAQDFFGRYWVREQGRRRTFLYGLALSPEIQAAEGLTHGAAFLIQHEAEDDPWEMFRRFLAARRGGSSFRYAEDAMDAQNELPKTEGRSTFQDGWGALMHFPSIVQGIYRRKVKQRPPITKCARIDLQGIMEQAPDPESRITLSERKDALGKPQCRIHWKISAQEKKTFLRVAQLVQQEFKRLKLPVPVPSAWLTDHDAWGKHVKDHYHPMGATRMSVNPREGVVDANCQVHGIDGLFIAGSSIFPTSGHANPTQMLIAMALRLADWLKNHRS